MASTSASSHSAPLTFDLPADLIDKLQASLRSDEGGPKSVSEAVRTAVSQFDFEAFEPERDQHRQISVRLPADVRATLNRVARRKRVSLGELVRAALEAMPQVKPAKKKAAAKKRR